ncbi:dual adapter for phosphotyrosine and 3-phosphotyrosine and 3-phosphoinositide-like [Xenia sp. Carnegie-2017]|uniref:dual adapter for phosphotyrosine and 3-phosphotyrosine and 3-phosphoinositide-like n=1 Tax=Xenia sp. Carnegie-2017 TaxID=2897299 RepID=UPI001F049839|nr:dual adapter for phosphotyrosine and 3-phosphotyrosine and 3-phosphoinositide-like [Xenia sp. Carnegie-2017]
MSSELRTKEGELQKLRRLKGWKTYYFKLERSYLHYFETEYTAKPIETKTRGDISKVELSKEDSITGFDIIFKSGDTWHLQAETNEERLDWMKTLKPDAKSNNHTVKTTTTTAPLTEQNNIFPPNYQRLYPNVHNTQGAHGMSDSIAPPAYEDIKWECGQNQDHL